jgi:hypothetical protein
MFHDLRCYNALGNLSGKRLIPSGCKNRTGFALAKWLHHAFQLWLVDLRIFASKKVVELLSLLI